MTYEYLILLIPAIFFCLLIIMLAKQNKIDVNHNKIIDNIDKRIEENLKKQATLNAFIKQGARPHKADEKIIDVGDGYLVVENTINEVTTILLSKDNLH